MLSSWTTWVPCWELLVPALDISAMASSPMMRDWQQAAMAPRLLRLVVRVRICTNELCMQEWEKIYFARNIPGCAFSLLLGNLYYAWQCGRLGAKEGRNDVTAQPYGINTTGVYITLYAINLSLGMFSA